MGFSMNINTKKLNKLKTLVVAYLACVGWSDVQAQNVQAQNMADYSMLPPLSEKVDVNPMVMLTLSGDHQLFLKAYNDYDDLDENGRLDVYETTYNRDFRYTGYFDSRKCYQYNDAENYFMPVSNAVVSSGSFSTRPDNPQYCPGANDWSGNFLNWATMTRMDIIRHVLYGGYRKVDEPTQTLLERSYLPNDAHSFAKYLTGGDISLLTPYASDPTASCNGDATCLRQRGITFCNTTVIPNDDTSHNVRSQQVTAPPLMRVVRGNYSLWATGERYQCLLGDATDQPNDREFSVWSSDAPFGRNGNNPENTGIYAYDRNPAKSELLKDFHVVVDVCGANSAGGVHDCKSYGSTKKPVGLMQNYGARNVDFGLMTRAFNFNKSDAVLTAGALRSNIKKIADEINPETGQFLRPAESIISSIDALRILDYMFRGDGEGDDDYFNHGSYNNTCSWHTNDFNEGRCKNWGNPFSQIMAESYRYFSAANAAITANPDGVSLPGLSIVPWRDPLAGRTDASCVNFNVIGFNASSVSFDNEDNFALATPAELGIGAGTQTIRELTNAVGLGEFGVDQRFFIGRSGGADGTNAGQCTPKTINNLGEVSGTCPDAPRLQGSFLMAGLAHYAKTNDVRTDRTEQFFVNTYGVTMAGNLPVIPVNAAGGRTAQIIPACRNNADFETNTMPVGNCALVDFRPIPGNPNEPITKYFVAWEDTEHGSDYDQDISGLIEIEYTDGGFNVYTTILGGLDNQEPYFSTPNWIDFGFVVSGTTADTIYFPSYVNKNQTEHLFDRQVRSFIFSGQPVDDKTLESPLYYATKWGSFTDRNSDGKPSIGDTGINAQGDPIGYALVRRPDALRRSLELVLDDLINRASTGTSASIESSRLAGEGLMLQTLYNPEIKNGNQTVNWVGTLNGLFMDSQGNIREDDGNKSLGPEDYFIEFVHRSDMANGKTLLFNRYPVGADGQPNRNSQDAEFNLDLEELKTLWSARDALANISSTNIVLQRGNTELAQNKRYIITGVDQPGAAVPRDGVIVANEVVPFVEASVASHELTALLDVGTEDEARKVVNYIRGQEVDGFRSRTINFRGGDKVWRLGDIVHSTPAIVARPEDGYDAIYGDDSYRQFRNQYRNRRTMVYVGANDGMLHAFNAGFFAEEMGADGSVRYRYTTNGGNGVAAHALGAEMWAYVPYNLLPHLKWLTLPEYNHVYYVDSKVYTFDVNIFDDDDTHPHGWGTILVVGMRFGGGEYQIERADGTTSTMRSAYIIMDVTDPEQPPRLITEISGEDLGFTTGDVEIVKQRAPAANGSYIGSTTKNNWYLVFGSGPKGEHALTDAISDQPAKLFYLDLNEAAEGDIELSSVVIDDTRKSFVNAIRTMDWNRDYQDDMLYVGVLGDHGRHVVNAPNSPSPAQYHGSLKHVNIQPTGALFRSNDVFNLLAGGGTNLPYSATPLTVRDRDNNYWVYTGTGRFLVKQDLEIDVENKYFGLKVNNPEYDPRDSTPESRWLTRGSINIDDLYNVSGDRLFVNSSGGLLVRTATGDRTIDEYLADIWIDNVRPYPGWFRELIGDDATNFTRTAFVNETLAFNSYSPMVASCQQQGVSSLYLLDMFTGLPQYRLNDLFARADGSTIQVGGATYREVGAVDAYLPGVASDPAIINNRVITQSEKGEIANQDVTIDGKAVRRSWREIPLGEINE